MSTLQCEVLGPPLRIFQKFYQNINGLLHRQFHLVLCQGEAPLFYASLAKIETVLNFHGAKSQIPTRRYYSQTTWKYKFNSRCHKVGYRLIILYLIEEIRNKPDEYDSLETW